MLSLVLTAGSSILQAQEPVQQTAPEVSQLPEEDCVLAVRRGRIAMEEGKAEDATIALKAALAACHDGLEPLLLSFEVRDLATKDPKLLQSLDEVESSAQNIGSTTGLSVLEILASSERTPLEELEKIVPRLKSMHVQDPKNPRLLRTLAQVQLRLKDRAGLRRSLEALVEIKADPWIRWALARLCLDSQSWSCAEKQLNVLAQSDDTLGFLSKTRLIRIKSATGRSKEALAMALELARENPDSSDVFRDTIADTLIAGAWLAWDSGDSEGARRLFAEVERIDPENRIARQASELVFANPVLRAQNQHRRQQKITESSDADEVLAEGAKLLAAGDASGGWDLLDQGTRLDPESVIGWYNLGIASQRLEKWEDAARAFKQAARLDPENPVALLGLGRALASIDRCSEAIPVLQKLMSLHPELYQAQYYLWKCYQALGQGDAAAEALKKYNANRPETAH